METKTMSAEELLRPRYRVIADYPESRLRIGDIVEDGQKQYEWWINIRDQSKWTFAPSSYPAIFKSLEWWEERKPSEMPDYIKGIESQKLGDNDSQRVLKVKQWHTDCFVGEDGVLYTGMKYLLPATESDYLTYINSHPSIVTRNITTPSK